MPASARWMKSAKLAQFLLLASSVMVPASAWAQGTASALPAAAAPSESAMVNLVRLLVAQKLIKKEEGEALMGQALAEAEQARAAVPVRQAQAELPGAAPGSIRVPYIPETVRAQIREELKTEVLAQARTEGWAAPDNASPEWVKRIKLSGDIRVRSQSNLYSKNNSNQIPDFARINQVGPLAFLDGAPLPTLNSTQDRASRLEVRARLGVDVHINDIMAAGLMLATGNDNSPISTNQNLGGGLAKRDIWLDQAWLRLRPTAETEFLLGRFANPFVSTDLLFDDDLRFDGVSTKIELGKFVRDDMTISVRGGVFPLDFGDPNYPANDFNKRNARERWLFSGQVALGAPLGNSASIRVAAAYHAFKNLRANVSEPCALYQTPSEFRSGVVCSTDNQRATFLRKGNTVFGIRDIVLDPDSRTPNSPQYVGLLFDYRIVNLNAELSYNLNDNFKLIANGDYVKNIAFKRSDLCRNSKNRVSGSNPPYNNVFDPIAGADPIRGNLCAAGSTTSFTGGNQGYMGTLTVEHDSLFKRGGWQAKFGYRYLESDAVVDAYTDSDFHLGGTNAKGYTISAKASMFDNMTIGARWLSANEISGEPFRIDVLQADLEVKF